ncbi:MAG: hypothetical protein ACKO3C_10990 [Betaproteobacteria bacterium]
MALLGPAQCCPCGRQGRWSGQPSFISISTPEGATLFLTEQDGDCAAGGSVFLVTRDITEAEEAPNLKSERLPWGDLESSLLNPDGNRVRVSRSSVVHATPHDASWNCATGSR